MFTSCILELFCWLASWVWLECNSCVGYWQRNLLFLHRSGVCLKRSAFWCFWWHCVSFTFFTKIVLGCWSPNRWMVLFWKAFCKPCPLSIAVECATSRLSTCLLAWSAVPARLHWPWPGREIKSSKFRHVCYRINILDSRLSPSSIILVPA